VEELEKFLREVSWPTAALLSLAENLVIFALAVAGGALVARMFEGRRLATAPRLTRLEVIVAAGTVVLNAAVTLGGLALWRAGIVHFRTDVGPRAWLDVLVLILVMDLAMYGLHRVAHAPMFFPLIHRLHHRYERTRPLTLFVLSPIETVSFGALWLLVISVYSTSWLGMSIYLGLNVAFGALGHIAVEPIPSRWIRWPGVREIATTTFHAQHHADPKHNFGFYTLVWDRLFKTLSADYEAKFGMPLEGEATEARAVD
jgi:lathosterol oxidase